MEIKKWFKIQYKHSSIPIFFIKFPIHNLFLFTVICFALFMTSIAHAAGAVDLPQTGQTKCYDTAGTEIACATTGQDGEIQAGVAWPNPRFVSGTGDEADCVTDNLTGLMWPKNGNLPNGTTAWISAIDYPRSLTLCGHSDWRLPNINELESLVNADTPDSAAWLNTQGFTNVQSGWYWSSTSYAGNTGRAWIVGMSSGDVGNDGEHFTYYVLPVRGSFGNSVIWKTGQTTIYRYGDDGDLKQGVSWPSPRFSDESNGEVMDNLTGLVWTKDAYAPGPSACSPAAMKTWQEALDYVKCLNTQNYLGHNDWRLPNRKELMSLVDFSHDLALPSGHPFTNVQRNDYWSSTTYANNTGNAWGFRVSYGYPTNRNKGLVFYVWPVRAGIVGQSGNLVISILDKDDPSRQVSGAAADGVSRTEVRITGVASTDVVSIAISDNGDGKIDNCRFVDNGYSCTYTAPLNYCRQNHPEDVTQSERQISITITVNGQAVNHPLFKLSKPPVVLLHGIWSDSKTWETFKAKLMTENGYKENYINNYSYVNDTSFINNKQVIGKAIKAVLDKIRLDNFVAKKADVVAHSMGGLITKLYGDEYNIRSITTVGTPHFGSPWGDLVWSWVDDDNWLNNDIAWLLKESGHPSRNGAVQDLRLRGGQHCGVNNCIIDVPNYVITGISPITDATTVNLINLFAKIVDLTGKFIPIPSYITLPVKAVDNLVEWNQDFFDHEENDWIVAKSSQEGYWVGVDDDVWWHGSETGDQQIHQKIVGFLHRTSDLSSPRKPLMFQSPLSSPVEVTRSPMKTIPLSGGTISFISPSPNQTFRSGDTVNVSLNISTATARALISTSTGQSTLINQAPYTFQFAVSNDIVGPLTITAIAVDDAGYIGLSEVVVNVNNNAQLVGIEVYPNTDPIELSLGSTVTLTVFGTYNDGISRLIGADISFTSSNPAIIEVSPEGRTNAKAIGTSRITVGYSGITKELNVVASPITFTIPLREGWNFISLPLVPQNTSLPSMINDISSGILIIWGYDNQTKRWLKYNPLVQTNELTTIEYGKGYWIYMNKTCPWTITGQLPDANGIRLYDGWNLIGYDGQDGKDIMASLNTPNIAGRWSVLWNWGDGEWYLKHKTLESPVMPLQKMNKGKAYWIKMKEAANWNQ